MLNIFSGLTNPEIPIAAEEAQHLVDAVEALPESDDSNGSLAGLGYAGITLRMLSETGEVCEYSAWRGAVTSRGRDRIDAGRAMERRLFALLDGRVEPALAEVVRRDLTAAS